MCYTRVHDMLLPASMTCFCHEAVVQMRLLVSVHSRLQCSLAPCFNCLDGPIKGKFVQLTACACACALKKRWRARTGAGDG